MVDYAIFICVGSAPHSGMGAMLAQHACGNVGPICSRIAMKKCQGITTIMYKYLQKGTYKPRCLYASPLDKIVITATIRVAASTSNMTRQ